MIKPELKEARELAKMNTIIPIAMEIFADIRTPMEVLKVLKSKGKNPYILESVENSENWGRYTFLGCNPEATIHACNGVVTIQKGATQEIREGNSHDILKDILRAYKSPQIAGFPTFTGGFVGYFAYDYSQSGEFCLMLYKQVIAFDHLKQKIFLIVNIETDDFDQNYIKGVAQLKDLENLVVNERKVNSPSGHLTSKLTPNFSEAAFVEIVNNIQQYIANGEVSQVVPSITFRAKYEGDLLPTYRTLRTINPSSYIFYMQFDDFQITGASPETLVSLKQGIVSTYPLAGTCKRTNDEAENKKLQASLLSDPKELAEHEMLVELGKDDLSKVCESNSVNIEEYRGIKTCSHVYHIESKISGILKPEYDAFDAMSATLPAGTLSGAPRRRAMEIIREVEETKRDVYGGAIGYIDFTGDMDLCIGIRMAVLRDDMIQVQAGAGVVAQSIPEKEYQECCNKAKAMLDALNRKDDKY